MRQELGSILVRLDSKDIQHDHANGYVYDLPSNIPEGDIEGAPFRSSARLFENGREIGPRSVAHEQIRSLGMGRFSHWTNQVYFSASDNSSPVKNGREYHLLVPAGMFTPNDAVVALGLENIDLDEMKLLERFAYARAVFRRIWRNTPLPDFGRLIELDTNFNEEFARLSPENDVTSERKYALDQLFKLVLDVDGDVAECGAFRGGSAFFLARRILENNLNKRLCLFDSFEGLSDPAPIDGDYWVTGALTSSIDDIERALAPLGATPFVEYYKGWIPDRFEEVADRRFCFVHIDVDLHAPTADSIDFFYPRMNRDGIILLDDYGFETCPGATKAIDDFMADKPEPIINLSSGGAFILKRS